MGCEAPPLPPPPPPRPQLSAGLRIPCETRDWGRALTLGKGWQPGLPGMTAPRPMLPSGRYSMITDTAHAASLSVIGFALTEKSASIACVSASTPVEAVSFGGIEDSFGG